MKRKLAILLSVVLALGAAPVSAFGAEDCRHHAVHTADCGYSEGEDGSPCEYVCGICEVQALIDALPAADEITEDMAEEVGDQLMEIDAEKAELSDAEMEELDITLYRAAAAALVELNEGIRAEDEPMLAADAGDEQPVMIAGKSFTSADLTMTCGNGTATLDVGTMPYTLTLDNVTITSTNYINGIQTKDQDLKIVLKGTNKIETPGEYGAGIWFPGANITIEGTEGATLELVSKGGVATILSSGGDQCGNVTITNVGYMKLVGDAQAVGTHGTLTIENSTVEVSTTTGIDANNTVLGANNIVIDNSNVTVTGSAAWQMGIGASFGDITIQNGSEVKVNMVNKDCTYGIYAGGKVLIEEASKVTVENILWHGIYGGGSILVEGNSEVTGEVEDAILCGGGDITIHSSKVTGESTAANWNAINSGNDIVINDSEIDVKSGYPAIYASNSIEMVGGKVTAEAINGAGIYTDGTITVDGTELLAIGGEDCCGIAQDDYSTEPTFQNVVVTVSEDGTNYEKYNAEEDNIYNYRWVKTSAVTQEEIPNIEINYKGGMLTGFGEGTYLIDDKEVTPENGKVPMDGFTGKDVSIVKKGNGTTTLDSAEQKLEIPARPAAPTGVSGGKGKISGVNSDMEYRPVGADAWTPVSGDSVTGLSKGEYEVRLQGTDTQFASEAATVTVTKKGGSSSGGSSGGSSSSQDEPTYPPKVEENEGGTASISTKHPEKGDTVTVTPEAEEGFVPDKVIVTDKNGNEIEVKAQEDGTFTFIQPEGTVTVEVIYKEEQPEEKPAEQPVFSDVKETDWYFEAVQAVTEKELMGGVAEDTFSPAQKTTRGMIAAILYRMSGESYPDEASIFPDVKEGAYYNPAVIWGADHSVLKGYDDGLFRPDRTITREELALLIYNFAKYQGLDVSNIEGMGIYEFTDFGEISDWSMTAIRYCVNAGLLSGRVDGSFDPKGLATRAEVASVIQRFLEK